MAVRFPSALATLLLAASVAAARAGADGVVEAPGRALRAALLARAAGDASGAAERFAELVIAAPEVGDHASELRVEALLAAGAPELALGEAEAFHARFAESWLLPLVLEHEGVAHAALGDEPAARSAYAQALERLRPRGPSDRARLLTAVASSFERSGEPAAAAERWGEIWTRHPTSEQATAAEAALERLAARDPALHYRTAGAFAERCRRLSAALHNEEALVSCDAALAAAPGEQSLLRERADLLFRMRRYSEAVVAFGALGEDADAVFWRTRSLARAGRVEEAIASFGRLAQGSDRELAARARFLMGTLQEDSDVSAAEASYRQVAEQAPDAAQRAAAEWRRAWLAWRRGDFAGAAPLLERYAAESSDPAERTRGAYWLGRAFERLGRAEGRERLVRLAGEVPISYYGWRAASRLAQAEAQPADVTSAVGERAAETPPAALPPAFLRRLQTLLEAGLDERASIEIDDLAASGVDPGARLAYAQLLLEAGRFDRAQRLMLDLGAATLAGRPTPGAEARWWLAWPTAYDRSVEGAARAHSVDPALVYAVMREESGYQPDALSVVGARGLTQLMPDTGRRLAGDLGAADFDPAELLVPERNLELGAFYLSQLMTRFDGRMSAAIASYNAGPEAVGRWLASDAAREDDEWVESIPYDQTRAYVKRVLSSVHAYRVLYGS